ncbi:unnamed protein product, partial [Prorocentrum cordatum]
EHGSFIAKGMVYQSDRFHNFTVIKGLKAHGLLIDPGASRGLIGTDTFADIVAQILRPRRLEKFVKWKPSINKFTGITADPQKSLSLVSFPIGLQGIKNATFAANSEFKAIPEMCYTTLKDLPTTDNFTMDMVFRILSTRSNHALCPFSTFSFYSLWTYATAGTYVFLNISSYYIQPINTFFQW